MISVGVALERLEPLLPPSRRRRRRRELDASSSAVEAVELLELSSEPQAANARASTSVAMMAGNPRVVWVIVSLLVMM